MYYVGIDYHKKYSHMTAVDREGQVIASRRVANEWNDFEAFFADVGKPVKAVLEATRTWGVLFDMLEEMEEVDEVVLAHPGKVRMIAEAKVKTDKIDAGVLAHLLRANLIPAAYIPSQETRLLKEMVRQRMFLVRMRTRLKNRVHVLLDRLHVRLPEVTDLFGKRGMEYLRSLTIPGLDGVILREDLELLEVLNRLIKDADREVGGVLRADERVERLQSLPGVGAILASVIALEIDEVGRFGSPGKLASYAGLVPSTFASGGKITHGKLIKMSNRWLRWAFVEAAWAARRSSPYCGAYFEKIKRRKGATTAAIALARRLVLIAWQVLTQRRLYEERPAFRRRFVQKASDPAALTYA